MEIIERPTKEEIDRLEKLYKLYIIKDNLDNGGTSIKYECVINKERGIFKQRRAPHSKDHIMEQVAYELALLLGVNCCKASCRKSNDVYGAFSRYETVNMNNVITYSNIMKAEELDAETLLERTINICHGNINAFVKELYQFIIFDYIMGQMDRHLENLSIYRDNRNTTWYPLYDNGLCCFSFYLNDSAIECLKMGHYSSRMGLDSDILEAIIKYRNIIWPGDLRQLIHYDRLSPEVIEKIILKADKYKQIGKERRQATVNFIYNQAIKIHKVNGGEIICM